jgi:hypothetical protein
MEGWRVRGSLGSDVGPHSRFKYGMAKVGTRLDTRDISLLVSLQADGTVVVRGSRPGSLGSHMILHGRIVVVDGRLVFAAIPLGESAWCSN